MKPWIVLLFLFPLWNAAFPQETSIASPTPSKWKVRHKNFIQKTDSILMAFQRRTRPLDSNYTVRTPGTWTFKVKNNISRTHLKAKGHLHGDSFKSHMKTNVRSTVSLSATYRGVTLGFAVNPARLTGKNHDFELNVTSYGNRYGFDYNYMSASTFHGYIQLPVHNLNIGNDIMKFRSSSSNIYYVFNNKKFSLPAAFTQSYLQKRSAGSFFLGASYFGSNMRISTSNPAGYDIKRISTIHAGVNVGYGYNLVAPHNWLFHFSFQPTMVLFSYNRIFYYDDTKDKSNDWSDILVTGRIAVVHYFNKRYFGGLTFNYNDSRTGDSDKILISNGKWKGRVILGMRL